MFLLFLLLVGGLSQELTGQLVDEDVCMSRYLEANIVKQYNNADRIIDNIYLGDVCAAHNRTWLVDNNISFVFNVASEWNNTTYHGIELLYFPFDDATNLDIKSTRRLINNIASRLVDIVIDHSTSNILVHCNMGISRSSAVVVRYLQIAYHMNYRTAMKLIKDIRPVTKPNSLFKRILINLDQ
jgi:protein tyrosine/serine phosphatase